MAELMVFKVVMHCEGCAGGVRKSIKKIPGVETCTVDYKEQKAVVIGTADTEDIMSRIRRSGKTVTLLSKSPAPQPTPAVVEAETAAQESSEPPEPAAEEKKKGPAGKPFFSFKGPKMPALKMPALKMPKLQKKMPTLKMQDLQKRMPNVCDSLPKNFVTNACREFMSKGVFYAASHDISDSELESLKGNAK